MGWLGDLFLGEKSEEWYREQLRKLRDDERTLLNEQAKIILKARGLHLDNNKEYLDLSIKRLNFESKGKHDVRQEIKNVEKDIEKLVTV